MRTEFFTIASRIVILFSSLAVVWLNTKYVGLEGQGTAALISFGILLIVTLSNFIGGGALVYLVPRMANGSSFLPSVVWAVASTLIFYFIFRLIEIVPVAFILHVCILGFLQSLFAYFMQLLLARERLLAYNISVSLQVMLVPVSLAFLYITAAKQPEIFYFIIALYVSFSATVLVTSFMCLREISFRISGFASSSNQIFSLGKFAQGGNILHLLNQRLNYVFLENLVKNARHQTGLLSLGMYAAEAVWTVGKSLSVVQYARIANLEDEIEQRRLTKRNLIISFSVAAFSAVCIVFIPDSFYTFVFRSDTTGLRSILIALIPGILANALNVIYSSWFSGRGLHRFNFYASGVGLVVGVLLALTLIPSHAAVGAAWAASAAFTAQWLFFVQAFARR